MTRVGAVRAAPFLILALGCAATGPVVGPASGPTPAPADSQLRLMTFNIRYGTATDGPDAWPHRRAQALNIIRAFAPAVLGVQEALRFQLDELGEAIPALGQLGVGRDDGVRAGEYAAILYDHHRLAVLEQGNFWLSDTPEVPGSMTWGNRYPRIVCWARLADRAGGGSFYVFNTHWDHESQPARERGAALMLERMRRRSAPSDPLLVLGDFNSGEDNPAFLSLLALPLVDTFRVVHPALPQEAVGTYHGFRGERAGAKIDAVLASPPWRVLAAGIVLDSEGGRYPSDHFPVTATLSWPPRR